MRTKPRKKVETKTDVELIKVSNPNKLPTHCVAVKEVSTELLEHLDEKLQRRGVKLVRPFKVYELSTTMVHLYVEMDKTP